MALIGRMRVRSWRLVLGPRLRSFACCGESKHISMAQEGNAYRVRCKRDLNSPDMDNAKNCYEEAASALRD
eukprot:Skav223398  [mRNA]  locus=scaffold2634:568167:568379:- [translate_table: standard]